MARKTSGGRTRNARGSQGTPVEDAEIVSEAEGAAGSPAGGPDGSEDPTPTGTASVEAMPGEGGDAAHARSGAEGTSEVEAPTPAASAADAADPSRGAAADGPHAGGQGDAWESVPGAVTPAEAGHPEAVEEALATPVGGSGDGEGGTGTDLVRAPSVEIVPPDAPPAEPEPAEPTAADAPDVVVTPPPGGPGIRTSHSADEDAPSRIFGTGTAGAATGAALGAGAAMAASVGDRRGDADAGGARAGRGTPPDLDPPDAAPPRGADAGRSAPSGGGGFLPLLLGGVLAGLIGLGAGWLLFGQDGDAGRSAGLEAQVAELRTQVEGLTGGPDLSPVNARIDEVAAGIPVLTGLEERLGAIETALAAPEDMPADDPLAGRLEEVEGRFIEVDSLAGAVGELREQFASLAAGLADAGEGTASGAAGREALGQEITSAARRLDALAAEVEALSAGMEGMGGEIAALGAAAGEVEALGARLDEVAASADATRGELDALVAERDRLVAEAEAEAAGARAEAALERLRAAVDAGVPFAEPLAAFEEASGETVPDALSARAEEGVPSLAQLQDAWDEAARAALAEAPAEPGPGGFLRAQLGIRSLNAREGDAADAILSRAGAALREGDLNAALAELDGLTESPRAALDPWVADAEDRLAATEALAGLDPASGDVSAATGPGAGTDASGAVAPAGDASATGAAPDASGAAAPPAATAPADDSTAAEVPAGDAAAGAGSRVAGPEASEGSDPPPAASITPASE